MKETLGLFAMVASFALVLGYGVERYRTTVTVTMPVAMTVPVPTPEPYKPTIGIWNRNPGNVRAHSTKGWTGATGRDPWLHLQFDTDLNGLRAMRRVLTAYGKRHHLNTLRGILGRWTAKPKTKAQARELAGYMKGVAQRSRYGLDTKLDMTDRRVLARVAKGIIYGENGQQPYPESLFKQAFNYR